MAPGRHSQGVPGAGHARAIVAGVGAQIAGVIWILQWAHALVAHSPTQHTMERAPTARGDKLMSTFSTVTIVALIIAASGTAMSSGSSSRGRTGHLQVDGLDHVGGRPEGLQELLRVGRRR